MGLFSKVFKSVKKAFKPNPGALFGAVTSAAGGFLQNQMGKTAAGRQMTFQKDMSNTQYQRAMADMRLAGLNPILAYRMGGAGTPGGSTYSPTNIGAAATQGMGSVGGTLAAGKQATSARMLASQKGRMFNSEIRVLDTQGDLNQANAASAKATAGRTIAETVNEYLRRPIIAEQIHSAKALATRSKIDEAFYGKGGMGKYYRGMGLRVREITGLGLTPTRSGK